MLYRAVRPLLLASNPERMHGRVLNMVERASGISGFHRLIQSIYGWDSPLLETRLWGHVLPSPVGLAAGFDKNARITDVLFALGFGMLEVGTLTPRSQLGNPLPRMFRLVEDRALINRLGFNNEGLEPMRERLRSRKIRGMLGVNLGKNRDTPISRAVGDYLLGMRGTHPWADYFCINISSPNTEDLRHLQEGDALQGLLDVICREREKLDAERGKTTPVLIKLAPDWEEAGLEASIGMIRQYPLDGIVATNTSIERPHLKSPLRIEIGGLSGAPVFGLSTDILRTLYRELRSKMPIIGVGGIFSGRDAYEKIRSGASAVQIYTSLVYEGPEVVTTIKRELEELLLRDGLVSVAEAVGLDANRPVQD